MPLGFHHRSQLLVHYETVQHQQAWSKACRVPANLCHPIEAADMLCSLASEDSCMDASSKVGASADPVQLYNC